VTRTVTSAACLVGRCRERREREPKQVSQRVFGTGAVAGTITPAATDRSWQDSVEHGDRGDGLGQLFGKWTCRGTGDLDRVGHSSWARARLSSELVVASRRAHPAAKSASAAAMRCWTRVSASSCRVAAMDSRSSAASSTT
jgi:hypothetical protein